MGRAYYNFINSIKSEESKAKYDVNVRDFMRFCNIDKTSELLKIKVEQKIIDYIINLRKLKLASHTIHNRLSAIYHFYTMNDVLLNKVKINKYKGEFKKVRKDRAYSHDEIHNLLDISDLRMKICILLMASGGMRLGAVPFIKMKHLEKVDNLYKITVYENSNEEYFTFITPECSNFIDEYLKYRLRNGEKVAQESHVIRNEFDSYAPSAVKVKERGITKKTISETIRKLLVKAGLRESKEVHLTHGFRKFFTTQLVNARINPEIREMLLGHKIGLAGAYYKPTEQEMYDEYQKALDNLTIDPANRLQRKVELLTVEKSRLDRIEEKMLKMEQMYKK